MSESKHPSPWPFPPEVLRKQREQIVSDLLEAIGEDVSREGLQDTPSRVVKAWDEWFKGYTQDPKDLFTVFEDGAQDVDEIVLLTDIPVFSHCEHHITPIIGVAHVGYLPDKRIVGISKLARVVDMFARRLQVQERLTTQVANCIMEHLQPRGVGVIVTAKHLCMSSRGVKTPTVDTTTSVMRGAFSSPTTKHEFLDLVNMFKKGGPNV